MRAVTALVVSAMVLTWTTVATAQSTDWKQVDAAMGTAATVRTPGSVVFISRPKVAPLSPSHEAPLVPEPHTMWLDDGITG